VKLADVFDVNVPLKINVACETLLEKVPSPVPINLELSAYLFKGPTTLELLKISSTPVTLNRVEVPSPVAKPVSSYSTVAKQVA
jgi:hypothetical protein